MNKLTKKVLAVVVALIMVLTVFSESNVNAATTTTQATTAASTGTVSITVERFTVGQGYVVSPTSVKIYAKDTVADVFKRVMDSKKITYDGETGDYGFYLKAINNADTGKLNIPAEISAMPQYSSSYEYDGQTYSYTYDAPTNTKNDGNKLENKALGTGSYSSMSGWMFKVNGVSMTTSADQVEVKKGDVIRVQFSVFAYGADLGDDAYGYDTKITLANEDNLIKKVAEVNSNTTKWLVYPNVKAAYNTAVNTLLTYNVKQTTVDVSYNNLVATMKKPTYPTVTKTSIKSLKNVKKYKAKVTVKKISGVTGYQYKYSTSKKFKSAKSKLTTKTYITTKKLKKNKRCYMKVRSYKKINGERIFSKWSKTKSVKIKK